MTREEFESLTGIRPTWSMYRVIEDNQVKSGLDVAEFCRRYSLNIGGIAETIRHQADIMECQAEQRLLENLLDNIQKLKAQIDAEQEWKESDVYGTCMTQEEYIRIAESKESKNATNDGARRFLFQQFGFSPNMIVILDSVKDFERNKYGDHRARKVFYRPPAYQSPDCNYIRFNCAGRKWELVNGDLLPYDEPDDITNKKGGERSGA